MKLRLLLVGALLIFNVGCATTEIKGLTEV